VTSQLTIQNTNFLQFFGLCPALETGSATHDAWKAGKRHAFLPTAQASGFFKWMSNSVGLLEHKGLL